MGKNKSQRTKGNTKPSNSGRTAELLSSRGVNSFLGFGTLPVDLPGFSSPISAKTDSDDTDVVDSDFRLVLRKATKRDTVTKVKALQEFSQLCQEKDEEAVKRVLPFWPRIYCKLAIDLDRKVREAVQQSHKHLVSKVKKNLAPYLKSLMGVWLVSMCDPYAPSASAANQAFQIAFPSLKQGEALEYCKEEVFNYIEDILFVQTVDSISDPKVSSRDERETQYLRVVASCFNGLHLFLHTSNHLVKNTAEDLFKKLLNNSKYWKYATHKDPEVKRGWYSAAQALCQFIQPLIKENASKLCPLTLGSLDEESPLVSAKIWETSLHIMVTLKDCWQYINIKNVILPKLFKVLKEAGNGNASAIFHNLLPFLSKFPDSSIEPKIEFYKEFFGSLREGMKLESVRMSPMELNAIIKAYFECLRYTLFKSTGSFEEDQSSRNRLIMNELVPLVKDGMCDKNADAYSFLFDHLGEFLRYCEEQSLTEEAIPCEILNLCFEKITPTLVELLEAEGDFYLPQLSKYFHCLHYCKKNLTSKNSVRFSTSDRENVTKMPLQKRKSLKNGPLVLKTAFFCQNVLAKLNASPSLPLLKLYAQIIISIPSEGLFKSLLEDSDIPLSGEASVLFVKELLLPLLKNSNAQDNEDVKCLVSMVVAALSCTSEKTAVQTLNSLCDEGDTLVLGRLIQEASELRNSDSRLANWLRGEYIGQAMVRLAEELSNQLLLEGDENENELAWTLLNICFTTNREFDPFIASEYVNKILSSFTKSLSNIKPNVIYKQPETSFKIVKLVCDLAKNLFSQCQGCWYLPSAEALLLSLFQLSCKINDEGQLNSVSRILEETWALGAEKLVELQGTEVKNDGFLKQALKTIKQNLNIKRWKYNELKDIEKLSKRVEKLLKAYAEGLKNTEEETWEIEFTKTIPSTLDIVLPNHEAWIESEINYLTLFKLPRTLCVSSLLDLPLIEINLASLEDDLPSFLVLVHFTSKLLDLMYDFKLEMEDTTVDLSLKRNEASSLLSRHIPSLAMGVAFASNIYIEPLISKEHEIRRLFLEIPHTLLTCVKNIDSNEILPMMENTLKRANDGSYPHAITLAVLYRYFLEINPRVRDWLSESVNVEQILSLIKDKGTNVPHVIYCLMPHFDLATVVKLVKMVTDMLLSDEQVSRDNDCWILGTLAVCINSDNEDIFNASEIQNCTKKVLSYFSELWKMDPNILNPNWSAKYPASLQKTTFVSQLCSIFIAVVKKYPQTLDQDSWDAILCTLVGWIQRNNELWQEYLTEETTAIPSILSFKLLSEIEDVLNKCRSGFQELELLPNLLTEWEELYLENIYAQIIPLFVKLGEALKSKKPHLVLEKLLTSVSQSLLNLPADLILKSSKEILPKKFGDDLTKNLDFLLGKLHQMLISSQRSLTLGSHSLLISLMGKIPETNIGEDNSEDEEKSRAPPKSLVSTLEMTSQIVETLLFNFNIGDCCLVQPYTDSFTFTYVYMLSWMELLKLFSSATSELRSEYAFYLQKSNLLEELLQNLFKLMPNNPLLVQDNLKGSQIKTMFTEPFHIDLEAEASFSELQKVSCHVYLTTLRQLPALVRQWWHNRDKCSSDFVNRFTTNYVSSYICQQEIKAVQDTDTKFSNMIVKARPMAREVVAKYTMEDITFELVIKLPANHPLGPVTIETGQRVGVSSTQWRNWMLQLTTFLTYQNGSILDGLSLWKRNVDKRFEGIEECMICFYVLHGATCQLPKLTCRTCKKRFHSACLFKWFSTSQNSSCPLCRNLF